MTKEFRTYVEDVDRTLYDISDATDPSLRLDAGLTPDLVREISAKKDEPSWMLDLRLKALDTYQRLEAPDWGPGLEGLDMAKMDECLGLAEKGLRTVCAVSLGYRLPEDSNAARPKSRLPMDEVVTVF